MARKRLTDAQEAEIRRLWGAKNPRQTWTTRTLASAFGVSTSVIARIVAETPRGRGNPGLPGGGIDGSKHFVDR